MEFTEQYLKTKARVAEVLGSLGFIPVDTVSIANTTTIATKQYQTIVGLKQATLYFTKYDSEIEFCLRGEYNSEGRNALLNTAKVINAYSTDNELLIAISEYVLRVDRVVRTTYAAKLFDSCIGSVDTI